VDRRRQRPFRATVIAIAAFVTVAWITSLGAWQLFDLKLFDYMSTLRRPILAADAPIIVAIDEPSMADVNLQWPWPRTLHARLIRTLRAAGAKAIALDIIFSEPSRPESDEALAKALGEDVVLAGDETLIATPQADQLVRVEPIQALTETGAKPGIASIGLGRDGVFRQMPTYSDGFALRLAQAAGLRVATPPGDRLAQVFGPARTFPTVSYYQALDPQEMLPPGFFKDRVVIVGLSLQNAATVKRGAGDAFATSYTVHTGKLLPGVEIQATIFENLRRNLSVIYPGWTGGLPLLFGACVLAAAISVGSPGWRTVAGGLLALLLLAAISGAGLWFAYVFVSPLGAMAAYVAIGATQAAFDYAEERQNRKQIVRAFSQYLSPALVKRLADDPSHLKLGGERRTLSILFCDVRGFTTISERLKDDPEQLTALINRLLTPLSDIVLKEGTIDKYIGDCLMAFWNAPLDDPDHAIHAVSAALEMLDAMDRLNAELAEEALSAGREAYNLRIGIGVNTGECVVGHMGSAQRFDYSVLGDSVNLASRLEGASKNYGTPLLIGERTAKAVAHSFAVVELDRIQVKGRTEFSPVYTVVRAITPEQRRRHEAFLAAKYAGLVSPHFAEPPPPELRSYYDVMRMASKG
jgi:adenylate cyclase